MSLALLIDLNYLLIIVVELYTYMINFQILIYIFKIFGTPQIGSTFAYICYVSIYENARMKHIHTAKKTIKT